MNILFILQRYPGYGGIETVTKLLSEEMCRREGVEVTLFSTSQQDNPAQLLSLPNWELITSRGGKAEQTKQLEELCRRKAIDVVIYQDSYIPEEYLLECLAQQSIKVIVCEHNTPDALLIGYRKAYQELKANTPLGLLHKVRRYIRFLQESRKAKKHHQKMLQMADRYVLLSDHFRDILHREYQIDANEEKIVSIGNPVSLPMEGHPIKEKEALFVGRLTGQKGTDYLVQIWCKVAPLYPDWKLTIVGDGANKDAMQQAFRAAGVHNVTFEGFHADVLPYYQRASVLLLTSIYEGWAMVLFEAMSQGCIPFAFTSYCSVFDIIDHNRNGYLVKAFDVEGYVDAITQFINTSSEQQTRIRQEALAKAGEYTPVAIVDKWINLIDTLI